MNKNNIFLVAFTLLLSSLFPMNVWSEERDVTDGVAEELVAEVAEMMNAPEARRQALTNSDCRNYSVTADGRQLNVFMELSSPDITWSEFSSREKNAVRDAMIESYLTGMIGEEGDDNVVATAFHNLDISIKFTFADSKGETISYVKRF